MEKRGLSPVIATVLLVMLVLVLAAIIFLWAKGFVGEQLQKRGQPIENICKDVSFNAQLDSTGTYFIEITNLGNIPIYQFDIKQIKGGDESVKAYSIAVDPGQSVRKDLIIDRTTEKIIVYPAILGSVKDNTVETKAFTCLDNGMTLTV